MGIISSPSLTFGKYGNVDHALSGILSHLEIVQAL